MLVIHEIVAERRRQVEEDGSNFEVEDQYREGELARAAAVYAISSAVTANELQGPGGLIDRLWPWDPDPLRFRGRRPDLIYAAALIVAEIERLDRVTTQAARAPENPAIPPGSLTINQNDALRKLSVAGDWVIPHQIDTAASTLALLARKNLAEGRHISGWTRWRITDAGRRAARVSELNDMATSIVDDTAGQRRGWSCDRASSPTARHAPE